MLEIVNLTDINLKMFLDYVMSDIPRYFFFILDQKQYPEHSRFLIALDAGKIVGLCLIWKNDTVHIRGQNESIVKALFNALPQEFPIRVFNFEFKYKDLLHTLVPKPKHKVSMHRMLLKKENMIPRFQLNKPYTQKTLSKDDGLDIAKLMRKADKVFWRNVKVADLTFDDNQIYTGLYDARYETWSNLPEAF